MDVESGRDSPDVSSSTGESIIQWTSISLTHVEYPKGDHCTSVLHHYYAAVNFNWSAYSFRPLQITGARQQVKSTFNFKAFVYLPYSSTHPLFTTLQVKEILERMFDLLAEWQAPVLQIFCFLMPCE